MADAGIGNNSKNRKEMKKMNFVATAVALGALCLAGCSNDAEEPGTEPQPQPGRQVMMTMHASTAEPQTRAGYTEEGDIMRFSWHKDDAISVFVNEASNNNKNCKLTTNEDAKSATFTGTASAWVGTTDIYAIYPYKESRGYDIDPRQGTASLELANPQEFTVGGAFTNGFLVGKGTATCEGEEINVSPVSMKQVMSFVKLDISKAPGNVTEVWLSGSGEIFPTKAAVSLSKGEIIDMNGDPVDRLTMNVTDQTGPGDKSVSFALFPHNYSGAGIVIAIYFEGGKHAVLSLDGKNLERNVHYSVAVKYSE